MDILMDENAKKAYSIAFERAEKEQSIIKAMFLIDGRFWIAPLPKEYENAKKAYDINGVYVIDPADWKIRIANTFDLFDAQDNAKDVKNIDITSMQSNFHEKERAS